MTPEAIETPKRRIAKPIGLYIITVFDFIAVGVVPLLSVVWVARQPDSNLPFASVLISVAIPVLVMAACVWALVGDNAGRWFLLTLVTISSVLLIVNNLLLLSGADSSSANPIPNVRWIVRATFWLGINWWYFNRRHVVAYFKQNRRHHAHNKSLDRSGGSVFLNMNDAAEVE